MTVPENVIIEKIQCWHCKHFQEKFPKMFCNVSNQKIQAVIFLQDLHNGCDVFNAKDEDLYIKCLTNYTASKAEDQAVMN